MIETMLGIVKNAMQSNNIPYEFMRFTSDVEDRYWIGEYSEVTTDTEDGYNEYTMMLTGTTQKTWLELLQDVAKIEDHFPQEGGLRTATEKGAVVIFYDNSFPVSTGEADLKRIQINLHIKTWKGLK
jgi:hypothetical protein